MLDLMLHLCKCEVWMKHKSLCLSKQQFYCFVKTGFNYFWIIYVNTRKEICEIKYLVCESTSCMRYQLFFIFSIFFIPVAYILKKKVLISLFVIVISNILIVFIYKNITKITWSLYVLLTLQSFAALLENINTIVTKQLYLNRYCTSFLICQTFRYYAIFFYCLNMSEKIHLIYYLHNQQWL